MSDHHNDHDGGGHPHEGGGGHAGHAHGVSADADRRWPTIALGLIGVFMLAEVVGGALANSLALISDAAHMLTDVASIVLALIAMRLAARPDAAARAGAAPMNFAGAAVGTGVAKTRILHHSGSLGPRPRRSRTDPRPGSMPACAGNSPGRPPGPSHSYGPLPGYCLTPVVFDQ